MPVGWLIDAEMFPHYRDDLVAAIRANGDNVELITTPSPPFRWDDVGCSYRETFPPEDCVVTHGDIELVTRVAADRRWTPGGFATVENYYCSKYVTSLGRYWLNNDYAMLPFGELLRREEFLFDTFGVDGKIFVRPDSPLKLFTGQTATRDTFAADVEYMGFYEFPPSAMVVVSSPKQVVREWRFVVSHQSVVTGCMYAEEGEHGHSTTVSADAKQLAEKVAAAGYQPDPVWIVDICETKDGQVHLLEIGGFSFADLYACNLPKVVHAVGVAATEVWRQASAFDRHSTQY